MPIVDILLAHSRGVKARVGILEQSMAGTTRPRISNAAIP